MKINLNIQILRAIAVIVVILNHIGIFGFKGGFYGVDLFFVISGYVISSQLLVNNNLIEFYKKRVNRILPASFFTVVATIFASYLLLGQFSTKSILEPVKAIGTLSVNYFFAHHYNNYFELGSSTSPFLHFWSLAVEEQFYLFIPVLFLLFSNKKNNIIKIITSTLVLFSFIYFLYLSNSNPNLSFYSVFSRGWELGLGVLIALYTKSSSEKQLNITKLIWLFLLFIFTLLTIVLTQNSLSLIIISIISTFLVYLATLIKEGDDIITRTFVKIGNASYSLYLAHFPIITIYLRKYSHINFAQGLLLLFISTVVGFIMYKVIENPSRNKLNKVNSKYLSFAILFLVSALSLLTSIYTNSAPKVLNKDNKAILTTELASLLKESLNPNYSPKVLKPELALIHGQLDLVDGVGECIPGANMCSHNIKNGEPLVVLFGDSHATMWWSSLYYSSLKNNFNAILISKGGCPPAYLDYNEWGNNTPTKEKYDECVNWFKSSLDVINKLNPKTLIITGSGTTSNWALKLPETFKAVSTLTGRKILLADFSYPNQNILDCYSANSDVPAACIHDLESNIIKTQRLAEEQSSKNTSWELYYPDKLLCLANKCPGIVDGIYVYRDQWHITRLYGQLIAEDFANLLNLKK